MHHKNTDPAGQFAVLMENTPSADTKYRVTDLEAEMRPVFRLKTRAGTLLSEPSEPVDADTPAREPLTPSFVGMPSSHDGETVPGRELYQSVTAGRHQIVVAGELAAGPLLQFRVPDRARLAEYRVRILQVTGED